MSSIINNNNSDNTQALSSLISDLEEITEQFNQISTGFDIGEIDFEGFEMVLLQLQDCQEVLEEILDSRQAGVSAK